ncbi:leucine-rich repeat serine/threonine-protein kinase 1-like [Centruroides sculpturatus]|uniref:leucine-rich repeat serine/threonine-protein kinase 1-like n=2 Tax=Centruroides sculpturatus TaxID=218467 RepID=UPI000C6CC6C7|nr:leucine-rich repeat serine/threonine-protein kinase 1-like [Centruroides sculpturatus]
MAEDDNEEEFSGLLLHQAALWGNAELLEDLLHGEQLQYLNAMDSLGRTALHAAATNANETCTRILLQAGGTYHTERYNNLILLPNACREKLFIEHFQLIIKGHLQLRNILIFHFQNSIFQQISTPLHVAAENGHLSTVELLTEFQANLLAKDINGLTALDLAEKSDHPQVMEALRKAADEQEQKRQELYLALWDSCSKGEVSHTKQIIRELGREAELVINSAPNGCSTLLFKACEEGQKDMVKFLLDKGADGRIHPVTKYSPLYIACYYGRKDIVEIILKKFPELVRVPTVEKWLPIHAAAINGHVHVLDLLLNFSYPSSIMQSYIDKTGNWEYYFPFDINAKDVTGQTVLYVGCYVGNQRLVDTLLKFKIKAQRRNHSKENFDEKNEQKENLETSSRRSLSDGLHNVMVKLKLKSNSNLQESRTESEIRPIDLDAYCNNNTETCLHVAVRNKHYNIVSMLLQYGANPNLCVKQPDDYSTKTQEDYIFPGSSPLMEACKNHDGTMVDSLIRYGARDDDCKALKIACSYNDEHIVSRLLSLKAYQDPEFKINKKALEISPSTQLSGFMNSVTYSSMFPTTPVMINWHGQKCLNHIQEQWLINACVTHNIKLKLTPRNQTTALIAITRLDISNNQLTELPLCIFQMPSLKILNAAQNKIFKLPESVDFSHSNSLIKSKHSTFQLPSQWHCPVLEEIHLQENRLDNVPPCLFDLPSLILLDLSNNKLQSLPFKMWSAPKLRELNLSLNMLHDLPYRSGPNLLDPRQICNIAEDQTTSAESSPRHTSTDAVSIDSSVSGSEGRCISPSVGASPQQTVQGVCVGNLQQQDLHHDNLWSHSIEIIEASLNDDLEKEQYCQLTSLNLSHNAYKTIPPVLACFAVNLSRLNMSYNRLVDMGSVTCYPAGLKHLDLSHNHIVSWPTQNRVDPEVTGDSSGILCYNYLETSSPQRSKSSPAAKKPSSNLPSWGSMKSLLSTPCAHRRHIKLDNLRTFILADNQLDRLVLIIEEDIGDEDESKIQEADTVSTTSRESCSSRSKLLYPALSMLDISNNYIKEVPASISELTNLSVLNISGNTDICYLPPEMGLLTKLWNLNTRCCNLNEPLKSMIDSKKYKTMDVIGYLKSILEELIIEASLNDDLEKEQYCQLTSLNLSHNAYKTIPPVLACFAVNLSRLNMSYNRLVDMGSVTCYPAGLKHLDLSHNHIVSWPTQNRVDPEVTGDSSGILCYNYLETSSPQRSKSSPAAKKPSSNLPSWGSMKSLLSTPCAHRRHIKLDNLRTFILADNQLDRLVLIIEEDIGDEDESKIQEADTVSTTSRESCSSRSKLLYPALSMLDISNNYIKEVPASISELTNLSVLNISGNTDICYLPPEMGLLTKLWNLNTRCCNLNEPLKSMIDSKKYKTMDVIGYLKSILEDAKPYARMKLMIVGVEGIGKTSLLDQLRQEGTGTYRKKPPEHWAKRMGNKNINQKTSKGISMSTVGVDVGDWVYEKKVRGQSSYGPVIFRTWDFGGQARAPNAPVLIVGTHYDLVKERCPPSYSEELQQLIREKFINVVDADKYGLPRVLDTIEVSCKTRHNVKLLCNLIYDTVFDLKCPGSKERLLEQRIPATYLALEDVVGNLSVERHLQGKDPVLRAEQYNCHKITQLPNKLLGRTIHHGVLLHYEDATLKDLYFLDPQWLCDMLAHVVTIREINPFARNGIMKIEDLKHVFKSSQCAPTDAQNYILYLLNKFEVALTWDNRTLLIPSLLPTEEQLRAGFPGCEVRIPLRSRSWALRKNFTSTVLTTSNTSFNLVLKSKEKRPQKLPLEGIYLTNNISKPEIQDQDASCLMSPTCFISHLTQHEDIIRRLLIMSYFPSGFWSRLMTRMLADDLIVEVIRSYFILPKDLQMDPLLASILNQRAEWVCWQTGMELRYLDSTLFRMKEILPYLNNSPCDYRQMRFLLQQEGVWNDVDINNSSILEILLPNQVAVIQKPVIGDITENQTTKQQVIELKPSKECVAKLLSLAVDHVDTLLEDWYPTLGTRFVHTSEGKFLVTRLVPCTYCLATHLKEELMGGGYNGENFSVFDHHWDKESWQMVDVSARSGGEPSITKSCLVSGNNLWTGGLQNNQVDCSSPNIFRRNQGSRSSTVSHDSDSGVGPDSNSSSRKPSAEGRTDDAINSDQDSSGQICATGIACDVVVYNFMVEDCILVATQQECLQCPSHGNLSLTQISPDIVFVDLGERFLIQPDSIRRGKMLGRGAFGFVFKASVKQRGSNSCANVAMKMLQPVDPGFGARQSDTVAYKAAWNKWQRDPLQYACKAYCTARQELNILMSLRHTNIVPLVGVCTHPLALVLQLAPQGALDSVLRNYRRSGARLDLHVLQKVIIQIAKALEYLHQQHIIYRDLKSENVLVWDFPPPFHALYPLPVVEIKLADYGISRSTLPTGTKGFGGTEGFMAPEIMRYNGEEEYTEKVDCFSFGMFMYELITLHLPFEGHECAKDHILDGGRPSLTYREMLYPTYVLDLMTLCWSQQPKDRPSASQIVSIATAPEFTHLVDIVSLNDRMAVLSAGAIEVTSSENGDGVTKEAKWEVWLSRLGKQLDILSSTEHGWRDYKALTLETVTVTALCLVNDTIWLGDSRGKIHIYSIASHIKLSGFSLETMGITSSAIRSMCYLKDQKYVAMATSDGRLWLCNVQNRCQFEEQVEENTELDNVADFIQELGSKDCPVFCIAAVSLSDNKCELWCGQTQGSMKIFALHDAVVTSHEVVYHYDPVIDNLDVTQLVSNSQKQPMIWSYVYPGCVAYHWDTVNRTILHKLDCSKLAPCSESLMSISIEEHLSPGRCQVTAMAVLGTELYIGTTWGCIIVAESITMRPITIFRPFEEEVKAILPLGIKFSSKMESPITPDISLSFIAAVGKGYRNLIGRYTALPNFNIHIHDNMYLLLIRTDNWSSG